VTTLTRFVVSIFCALVTVRSTVHAQSGSTTFSNPSLPRDLISFLRTLPKWSVSTALNTSYGYKDNLLLSSVGEERSAFVRGSAELSLLRVPQGQFDYSLLADVEGTHYFSAKTVDHDARVWLHMEPAYRVRDAVKFALPLTGYYNDQTFDISDDEFDRSIAQIKAHGVMVRPSFRWNFHPAWWFEAQAVGQRKRYKGGRVKEEGDWVRIEDGAHDGWVGEGILRLAWAASNRVETRLTGGKRWRNFDQRSQYMANGREAIGTELKISERAGELRVDVSWDAAAKWKTTTRASLLHYRDNGSGYFNYREQKVDQELKWRSKMWLVRIEGSASRFDFGVQKAGFGIDPPARLKDEYSADLQIEREISQRWTIFGGYKWERVRSNDEFACYAMNEGLLGVRWSWEK
jgi:hypothetical protein